MYYIFLNTVLDLHKTFNLADSRSFGISGLTGIAIQHQVDISVTLALLLCDTGKDIFCDCLFAWKYHINLAIICVCLQTLIILLLAYHE